MDGMFVIRSLNYGGAERQFVLLAKGLHQKGRKVAVAQFYGGGPLEADLRAAGVTVYNLDKRGRNDIAAFGYRLVRLIRHVRPQAIYSWLETPNIVTAVLRPFYPGTRVIWALRSSNVDLSQYDWLARLCYWSAGKTSRFADLIISNSRSGMEHAICAGYPAKKMMVIPNGVDTDRFKPDPGAREQIRREWGIGDEELLIGMVARVDPMKDHPNFLRAAADLSQSRDGLRFACVGDGPPERLAELERLAEELGIQNRMIWRPARQDVERVYNAFDVAALSSSYGEGFPNVVGEAMACGVPCAVTDVGDCALVVGDTGFTAPPKDPKALADAMAKCLSSDRAELGARARWRIVEEFSLEKMIESTEHALWPTD